MRFFKTYTKDEISAPKNDIVGINSKYIQKEPVTLVLKEKMFSMSMDDFSIKDINGTEYFKCEGKVFSLRPKHILFDVNKQPVLNIQQKLMAFKPTLKIFSGANAEDANQIAKLSLKSAMTLKKFAVEFHNQATEKEEYLEMKCDMAGFSCGVFYGKEKEGAPMIAKVYKKKTSFNGSQTYYIEIAPGVDVAFLTAIGICFDEFRNERRENGRK